MAGEWLKFEKATLDKPEVFAIAARLGIDPDAVVGKLIRVWSWFDTHTVDGNAAGVTPELLDRIAGATGFVTAMHESGWVVVAEGGVSLPNFDRHNGETAKKRALTAKRVAYHRAKGNAGSNAGSVTPALAREEKRREEEKKENDAPDGASPAPPKKPKGGITLAAYLAECEAAGVKAIPEDDAVFAYAERVGLPVEFLALAWRWFRAKYGPDGAGRAKRYADWRATFRNAVKDGWPKFWAIDQSGAYYLTTAGKQAQREYGDAG